MGTSDVEERLDRLEADVLQLQRWCLRVVGAPAAAAHAAVEPLAAEVRMRTQALVEASDRSYRVLGGRLGAIEREMEGVLRELDQERQRLAALRQELAEARQHLYPAPPMEGAR